MSIREDIENQYKRSLLEKNTDLTNTLRLIKSAIKDKDISVRSKGIKKKLTNEKHVN